MIDPLDAMLVLGVLWVLLLTVAVALMLRHLHRVDELAHDLHEDLAKAERDIEKLKAAKVPVAPPTTMAMPAVRLYPEPASSAQSYGRHAREG